MRTIIATDLYLSLVFIIGFDHQNSSHIAVGGREADPNFISAMSRGEGSHFTSETVNAGLLTVIAGI